MASTNRVVITFADGRELCTSYGVPVAGFVPGRGYVRTAARYSVTTSKHVSGYTGYSIGRYKGSGVTELSDAEFRALFADVSKAVCQ